MSEDINIGAISEALNNKVDLDQLNTNTQGLSYGSGWGMPSDKYIDLTLGVSGATYTAPANGWFCCALGLLKATATAWSYVGVYNAQGGGVMRCIQSGNLQGNSTVGAYVPAKKGDPCMITYAHRDTSSAGYVRFYYAEGEK